MRYDFEFDEINWNQMKQQDWEIHWTEMNVFQDRDSCPSGHWRVIESWSWCESDVSPARGQGELQGESHRQDGTISQKGTTLNYRMKVPHVIKVPQPNGGCKIVLYDFLIEIMLSEINSLNFCTSFLHSISNYWIIVNSTAKKVRTASIFGLVFS